MKNIFFFLLWLTMALNSYAQEAVNQPILDYFENMDMNQVQTGIGIECRGEPQQKDYEIFHNEIC